MVGAALRAAVSGLRKARRSRSKMRREFRILETMMGHDGNSPLKFSANDDEALKGLLAGP